MSNQSTTWCGRCGVDLPDSSVTYCPECGAERPAVNDHRTVKGTASDQGSDLNTGLRFLAWMELLASFGVAVWLFQELGTIEVPTGLLSQPTRTESSPMGAVVALGAVVQGILIWAVLYALAAMGDTLHAIRANTARRPGDAG